MHSFLEYSSYKKDKVKQNDLYINAMRHNQALLEA